jgi:hypothetical protein
MFGLERPVLKHYLYVCRPGRVLKRSRTPGDLLVPYLTGPQVTNPAVLMSPRPFGDEGWCLLVASLDNFFGNEPKPPRMLVDCGTRRKCQA